MFDPWLVGSEIDFGRWFNEAWHTEPVVEPEDVGAHDAVLVSQHYPDHCHPETLARLGSAPVWSVPQAMGRLSAHTPKVIPPWGEEPARIGALRVWRMSRPWFRPPAYHALVIAGDEGCVLHAPHGLPVALGAEIAQQMDIRLVATSRMEFRLPWFLGGAVNPGPELADALLDVVGALGLAIHDEDKRSEGLVSRLARIRRLEAGPQWVEAAVGEWAEL